MLQIFFLKNKYEKDGSDVEDKISKIDKIDVSSLVKKEQILMLKLLK